MCVCVRERERKRVYERECVYGSVSEFTGGVEREREKTDGV